ncbi:alpha/beta hydrolase [Gimesia panareensis]|uniref:alpha/beta hydrolase n=1 Tax=Gimesia panareensis TaxID=2527978 RepID=UPI00118C7544|nr:phospholipase [Gimesia panareensis]QDU50921.1 Phospholipase/Carboxylesterase [Gimesia panareensis]
MTLTTRTLGSLSCQIYDQLPDQTKPELIAVVSHGFGAPGDDLVPLGPEILRRSSDLASKVQFVFPAAPLSLLEMGIPGGRAWWMLDVAALNAAIASGTIRDQRNETPEGLVEAGQQFRDMLDALLQDAGLPLSRCVLAGFSQGSMVSTEVALQLPEPPAALTIWSGTLLCEQRWGSLAEQSTRFPIQQSHGKQDPILPFEGAIWLKEMLEQREFSIDFTEFMGPHTIPEPALEKFGSLLADLTSSL